MNLLIDLKKMHLAFKEAVDFVDKYDFWINLGRIGVEHMTHININRLIIKYKLNKSDVIKVVGNPNGIFN